MAVVENGFAENQIAIGAPHKIMQRVVAVFAAEAGKHPAAEIGFVVAVGVLDEKHVRFVADVHAAIAEFERQRNLQVIGEHG